MNSFYCKILMNKDIINLFKFNKCDSLIFIYYN